MAVLIYLALAFLSTWINIRQNCAYFFGEYPLSSKSENRDVILFSTLGGFLLPVISCIIWFCQNEFGKHGFKKK
jgi:hypothetical protein